MQLQWFCQYQTSTVKSLSPAGSCSGSNQRPACQPAGGCPCSLGQVWLCSPPLLPPSSPIAPPSLSPMQPLTSWPFCLTVVGPMKKIHKACHSIVKELNYMQPWSCMALQILTPPPPPPTNLPTLGVAAPGYSGLRASVCLTRILRIWGLLSHRQT